MSDTDSFIDEVTDEVRRDRLYGYLRKYGWIAVLAILIIVGGAAWNEYRKAQARNVAEAMGDAMVAALAANDTKQRAEALAKITPSTPGNAAVLQFMLSAAKAGSGETEVAISGLEQIASDGELPEIYRQIAAFKALILQTETLPVAELRLRFEAISQPGQPLRLLAEEQLALIDISEGDAEAAIARLQTIVQDAEASTALRERASQVIVALGGTPETLPQTQG